MRYLSTSCFNIFKLNGNILDPLKIIEKYGLDPLRYYLIKEVSFGNDGNISQEKLESCINSDLANNFGNLCQRVIAFNEKNLNLKIPNKIQFTDKDKRWIESLSLAKKKIFTEGPCFCRKMLKYGHKKWGI